VLELKTKKELASEAFKLSQGHELVRYRNVTYMPVDYETRAHGPAQDRTIWLPLNRDKVRMLAATQFDTLFSTDGELSSFDFMVAQTANQIDKTITSLLVQTGEGLKELGEDGALVPATGEFRPNTLTPVLNEDVAEKDRVFSVVAGWLDSEEEAHSLLSHLATCLAPGWSAVKYVLLLGEGRNGKSLLMKMLHKVIGMENVSSVTRQAIAEQSPVVTELNGKLLNLVYDGQATYLKDSGAEKTLIAGEPFPIRMLYQSTPTIVQTSGLFVEGLQREPKTGDKSTALQKRLVRYQFPNVYALDHRFEKRMLTQESLGAFLSLLIDHYVHEDEVAERLAPTQKALELQLEAMFVNSIGLQFLKYLQESDVLGAGSILGSPLTDMVAKFQSWRLKENDLGTWAEPDVLALFAPLLHSDRKSVRIGEKVQKVRVATAFKDEAAAFIESLEGTEDEADDDVAALVED
jgi:hypothetical protein